jgi:hypothetical protein
MFKPYEWQDPFYSRDYQQRIESILDGVAGASRATAASGASATGSQETGNMPDKPKSKLKAKLVLSWLKSISMKLPAEVDSQLSRDGDVDDAERLAAVEAALLDLKQSTPAILARTLHKRGVLVGYTYTKKSLEQMIGRLIRAGLLPGWTGGKAQKAAATDGDEEHDVDAEFGRRRRRQGDSDDDGASFGMTFRNRLHRHAEPSQKAARRAGKQSRDKKAIVQMGHLSDEQAAEAAAFWQAHPELEEG